MSGYDGDGRPAPNKKDPLVRFLLGCAAVAFALVVLLVAIVSVIGWRITREPAPGRAQETFLIGDESRYWCVELKPDDAGLESLLARIAQINDATRRDVLRGTIFDAIPIPRRRARLGELAPFTIELAVVMSDPASGPQRPTAWSARGAFSHGVLKLRAALTLMRWTLGRDSSKSDTTVVDGIDVTEVHDKNARFAVATVGNRLLVASDAARLGTILKTATSAPAPNRAELLARHESIRLDGEDAWGFVSDARVGELENSARLEALASFDVTERDELAFRVAVAEIGGAEEGTGFRGTRDQCAAVVAAFLPGVPADAIEIDEDAAHPPASGARTFTGRITGLSTRLAAMIPRIHAQGMPFAIPSPPSPPPPSDHRTDTPAAPPRAESPTPPR